MRDYYQVLGVSRNISQKDLKKQFYKLAKKYHPDTFEGVDKKVEKRYKEITEAYNALSSINKRRKYDMGGMGGNFVYSSGFSNRSSVSKKNQIITRLNRKSNFSINIFASELRVSFFNLEKIINKLIIILNINARIEKEQVVF